MASAARRGRRSLRPGFDPQRGHPPSADRGFGAGCRDRAPGGRAAAPSAPGRAILRDAGGNSPSGARAWPAYPRDPRGGRLFSCRNCRAGRGPAADGRRRMIDFYYWPTPNGWKVAIMLEECGLEYRMIPVNIGRGDQFKPEFLAISPNNRMPAIVDHDDPDGPMPVFESGAILLHLAERTGRFMPHTRRGSKECLEWLFWQVGNLGPMAGQLSHFVNYA